MTIRDLITLLEARMLKRRIVHLSQLMTSANVLGGSAALTSATWIGSLQCIEVPV